MKHYDKEHFFKCRATYFKFNIKPKIAVQLKSPPPELRRKMVKKESKYV